MKKSPEYLQGYEDCAKFVQESIDKHVQKLDNVSTAKGMLNVVNDITAVTHELNLKIEDLKGAIQ